jgi:RNA polymerase sigma factor (sigma-70 family)
MRAEREPDLAQLNRRFRPPLMAYFLRRIRNHAEAEDLTQEVFLKLAQVDTANLQFAEGFIFRMAANLLRDRARRQQVRTESAFAVWMLEGGGVETLDPARIAIDRDALAVLERALKDLPEPTRSIFVLYRLENADRQALGQAYGLSRNQIDRQLAKALAFLIERVGGEA